MLRYLGKRLTLAFFPAALLLLAGCGGGDANRGDISGVVKLDEKPLVQGSILFTPIEGARGSVTGGTIENGKYQCSGAAGATIGWNRVEIRAMRKTGKKIPKPFAPQGQTIDEQIEAIPPKFNSQSSLKVEVKRGDNTADFEVSSH
jgi:hypothetical protein